MYMRKQPWPGWSTLSLSVLCIGLLLLSLTPATAQVSTPAGFVRVDVETDIDTLLSMPFTPFDPLVDAVFTNQLAGSSDPEAADRVLAWDRANQTYVGSFKDADNETWADLADPALTSTQQLHVGDGFWLQNRNGSRSVFLAGHVILDDQQSLFLQSGVNMLGYPFTAPIPLVQTRLVEQGAEGHTNAWSADRIQRTYDHAWLDANGQWTDLYGDPSLLMIEPGKGYWYYRVAAEALTWTEDRPYLNIFPTNTASPSILGMQPSDDRTAVVLELQPAGQSGEQLEIYYKDLLPGSPPDFESPWHIAQIGLITYGSEPILWRDRGSADRELVSQIAGRLYLIARGDIDSDNDGLPDGRETHILHTDPSLADTDGDGSSDYEEVYVYQTDPLDPASVGSEETGPGQPPQILFEENFETLNPGSVHNQNGWALASGRAEVQSQTVYEGSQALALDQAAPGNNLRLDHSVDGQSHTRLWMDLHLQAAAAGHLPNPYQMENAPAVLAGIDADGRFAVFDGAQKHWICSDIVTEDWIRVTLLLDYSTRSCDVYLNGVRKLKDIGFRNAAIPQMQQLRLSANHPEQAGFVDGITVSVTEPPNLDTDGDGLPDSIEREWGLDLEDPASAASDWDQDGLTALQEYQQQTNPHQRDSDGDGISDGAEVAWGLDPATAQSFATLPWTARFEQLENYILGDLHAQNGWSVQAGTALISTQDVYSGEQSVQMPASENEGAILSHEYSSSSDVIIWSDLQIKLLPGPLPQLSEEDLAYVSAAFALDPGQRLAAWDGQNRQWLIASEGQPVDPEQWTHLTVKKDYARKTWNLYRDGLPVFKNLGFADESLTGLSRLWIESGRSRSAYLDDISHGSQIPAHIDDDRDGIPNILEDPGQDGTDHGETDPYAIDTDGDGMDDGRESELGTDPSTADSFTSLPWTAGFEEEEGYLQAPLHNQLQWQAHAAAQVTTNATGNRIAELQADGQETIAIEHTFGSHGAQQIWMDLDLYIQPGELPDPATLASTKSLVLSADKWGILHALGPEGWIESDVQILEETWVQLAVRIDYQLKEWTILANGIPAFEHLPFRDPALRSLTQLAIRIPGDIQRQGSLITDNLSIQAEEPVGLDDDDDGIPNEWERRYGFNTSDPYDRYADDDLDGLSNLEEYRYGTDPASYDSDGDGVSDEIETKGTYTDPASPSFTEVETVLTVLGREADFWVGNWVIDRDDIICLDIDGVVEYEVDLPQSGRFLLRLDAIDNIGGAARETFGLIVSVDGTEMQAKQLLASFDQRGIASWLLPWLPAGDHVIRVEWVNVYKNTQFRLQKLQFQKLHGSDTDENGRSDWEDNAISADFNVSIPPFSYVSPLFIEGPGEIAQGLQIEFQGVEQGAILHPDVYPGVGASWYADIPLSTGQNTRIRASIKNIPIAEQDVEWAVMNLMTQDSLLVRQGDRLRLTAVPEQVEPSAGAEVTLWLDDEWLADFHPSEPWVMTCTNVGQHLLKVQFTDQTVFEERSMELAVISRVESPDNPAVWQGKTRSWIWEGLPEAAEIQTAPPVYVRELSGPPEGGRKLELEINNVENRQFRVLARLYRDGPVLGVATVDGFWLRSGIGGYIQREEDLPDGTSVFRNEIHTFNMPDSVQISLDLFAAGLLFENGETTLTIQASDLDAAGRYTYRILRSAGAHTAPCHSTKVYQQNQLIGVK